MSSLIIIVVVVVLLNLVAIAVGNSIAKRDGLK